MQAQATGRREHWSTTHERFARDETNLPGSEHQFGIIMALALVLFSCLNYWRAGRRWLWTLLIAALFAAATYLVPAALKPLNLAWFRTAVTAWPAHFSARARQKFGLIRAGGRAPACPCARYLLFRELFNRCAAPERNTSPRCASF
jgi:hypothetical protein